ncbi:hypothetical protein SASPL_120919 [Salvia splendens]|uniref:Ras GTPase-activating protein-binding protein 1 n=1 Tax=Salvia splendens TaxID=180675 RepID=A0A8X8XV58_SALSN|nr:hypothetical protein SASPL_120919 [Salvia splendens]
MTAQPQMAMTPVEEFPSSDTQAEVPLLAPDSTLVDEAGSQGKEGDQEIHDKEIPGVAVGPEQETAGSAEDEGLVDGDEGNVEANEDDVAESEGNGEAEEEVEEKAEEEREGNEEKVAEPEDEEASIGKQEMQRQKQVEEVMEATGPRTLRSDPKASEPIKVPFAHDTEEEVEENVDAEEEGSEEGNAEEPMYLPEEVVVTKKLIGEMAYFGDHKKAKTYQTRAEMSSVPEAATLEWKKELEGVRADIWDIRIEISSLSATVLGLKEPLGVHTDKMTEALTLMMKMVNFVDQRTTRPPQGLPHGTTPQKSTPTAPVTMPVKKRKEPAPSTASEPIVPSAKKQKEREEAITTTTTFARFSIAVGRLNRRMVNQYSAQVTASQVGSYFVQQYYQVFQHQREYVHQFYNDSSSMMRVDGEISESASDVMTIHEVLMSLIFSGIEIKTIKSLESWNGGVLVVVTGSVKSRDFNYWRKFVQTFFLAPQEKGYFVLNDMFHFADDEVAHQPSAPVQEQHVDYHPTISSHLPDPHVSDYALEEEIGDYGNSVHVEGVEPALEYSYEEHLRQDTAQELEPELEQAPELEVDRLEEESPFEETRHVLQNPLTTMQEPQLSVEDPIVEPEKLTYASILRVKGRAQPPPVSQPAYTPRPPIADWNHISQPVVQQRIPTPSSGVDVTEESLPVQEGESKSVYVRNLPSSVTSLDLQQEFENFGRIKHDGIFLRNRMDTGVCYAFVEFEDIQSVQNALKGAGHEAEVGVVGERSATDIKREELELVAPVHMM